MNIGIFSKYIIQLAVNKLWNYLIIILLNNLLFIKYIKD